MIFNLVTRKGFVVMKNFLRSTLLLALAIACTGFLSSCNILGPAAYIIDGLPKRDAQYALMDRPTVVFVDDPRNALSDRNLRRYIGDKVATELMLNEIVTVTISSADAMGVARGDRHGKRMPIEAIGRAVGAEQVLYIEMMSFTLSPDNVTPQPMGICKIKVIDAMNRIRLFPEIDENSQAAAAYPVHVALPRLSTELYRSASGRRKMNEQLASHMAEQIAKVFYKHVPNELGSRLK